jgi:hypothetical protein
MTRSCDRAKPNRRYSPSYRRTTPNVIFVRGTSVPAASRTHSTPTPSYAPPAILVCPLSDE